MLRNHLLMARLGALLWLTDDAAMTSLPCSPCHPLPFPRLLSTLQHNSHKLSTSLAILSGLIGGVYN